MAAGTPASGETQAQEPTVTKADDQDDVTRWRTRITRIAVKDDNLDVDRIRVRKWKRVLTFLALLRGSLGVFCVGSLQQVSSRGNLKIRQNKEIECLIAARLLSMDPGADGEAGFFKEFLAQICARRKALQTEIYIYIHIYFYKQLYKYLCIYIYKLPIYIYIYIVREREREGRFGHTRTLGTQQTFRLFIYIYML